jgi:hypothetical protein
MSELTKEHFEQVISGLASKADLQGLATKQDLRPLATADQVQELARMVAGGFEDVQRRLDVTAKIELFEHKFQKLEDALHIKL